MWPTFTIRVRSQSSAVICSAHPMNCPWLSHPCLVQQNCCWLEKPLERLCDAVPARCREGRAGWRQPLAAGATSWPSLALAQPTLARDAGRLGRGAGQQDPGAVLPRAALLLLGQGGRVGPAVGPERRLLPRAGAGQPCRQRAHPGGHQVGLAGSALVIAKSENTHSAQLVQWTQLENSM